MVRRPRLSLVTGTPVVGEGPLPFQVGAVPHGRSEEVLELLLICAPPLLGGRQQVGELRQGCALVEPRVAAGEAAVQLPSLVFSATTWVAHGAPFVLSGCPSCRGVFWGDVSSRGRGVQRTAPRERRRPSRTRCRPRCGGWAGVGTPRCAAPAGRPRAPPGRRPGTRPAPSRDGPRRAWSPPG